MTTITAATERLLGTAVIQSTPLAGGDLSTVLRLTLADGRAVIAKPGFGAMREADMFRVIAATGAPTPAVLAVESSLLLMTELEADGSLACAWDDLAQVLGQLHSSTADHYGWSVDHAFGPIAIRNGPMTDWPDFWAERRLRCHIPHIRSELARRIERLADSLATRLPMHPRKALLHGDLWGGNILVSGDNVSGLIDPACSFGDREVDTAMLTLFDRPPLSFFDALQMEAGWRERQPIYRLWPLLVHLRLFGDSYASTVSQALSSLGA